MPRTPRLDIAGVAQHVIQRGNDRQPCFFREADYLRYLQSLREAALKFGCAVHAYALMTNHVHLLVTPQAPGGVSRMMQTLGRRYVRYINDAFGRTGTLWEGRYKACLIDSEEYVLACYRYIELNPVRAAMVAEPERYRWTSYARNALGAADPLVSPHATYRALGRDDIERHARYAALVASGIAEEELASIRLYVQRQRALGSNRFQAAIERQLQRRAGLGRPGRPKRRTGENEKVLWIGPPSTDTREWGQPRRWMWKGSGSQLSSSVRRCA
jgi:putative transposase